MEMWLERNKGENVIFTDVGKIYKKDRWYYLRDLDTHSSETETDKITVDYTIYNNGSS